MDVWSPDEFQTLLTIRNLDLQRGVALFQKYGPNARIIIEIVLFPDSEVIYLQDVESAAYALAQNFSTIFVNLKKLNFDSKGSSKVFAIRPQGLDTRVPVLSIPSPFLARTLALAVARHATAQKHLFFTILNSHPTLRSPAGWLFENYGHFFFSIANRRESTHGYLKDDPNPHPIPTTGRIISGSTMLKTVQPPFNFYWRPREPTFEGVDGLLRSGNIAWALQYAVGNNHCSATKGLNELRKLMNHKRNVLWRLVIVGPDCKGAEYLRDRQNLTGEWADTPVYACELPFGTFPEDEMQELQANWDEANERYPRD